MCGEVLRTACTVVRALQPLSLANETQIPPLGIKALKDISAFLRKTSLPSSGADFTGSWMDMGEKVKILIQSIFRETFVGRVIARVGSTKRLFVLSTRMGPNGIQSICYQPQGCSNSLPQLPRLDESNARMFQLQPREFPGRLKRLHPSVPSCSLPHGKGFKK
jgi:hypothetical protein